MKFFSASLAVLFASLAGVFAQVTVEIVPAQEQFLPNEQLAVAVRITNLSGQTLHLGADADWLKLSVESKDSFIVSHTGDVPVQGEFTLESSKVAIKRLDLSPYFSLTRPGRYAVTATVRVGDWKQEFTSQAATFDIIEGAKLWEQEFGVPAAGGEPEVRKYVLQQANYLKHLKLYVRLMSADEGKIFCVKSLGDMVSFSQPEPQVDRASNLHVLWQTGARGFAYRVVNPAGEVIARQTYDYLGTRPKLRSGDDGRIIVVGGVRRLSHDDLPAGETLVAPLTNAVTAPPVTSTNR